MLVVYAGTQGMVDQVPVESLKDYERELYAHFDDKHPDVLAEIRDKKEISDELKKKLDKALKKFTKSFVASQD